MKTRVITAAILLAAGPSTASDLLFCRTAVGTIDRFNIDSGKYLGLFVMNDLLLQPAGLEYSPDGDLYTSASVTNLVLRFDGQTGMSKGIFLDSDHCPRNPADLAFRGGLLYVLSTFDGSVSRFDAATGEPIDSFIPPGAFGTTGANAMAFGPDGDVYLTAPTEGLVIRYDGATGQPKAIVASNLPSPRGLDLGPDGNFYTAVDDPNQFNLDRVQVFTPDGQDLGIFVKFFLGNTPNDLRFGPDGHLYVSLPTRIDIYDIGTHENVGTLAPDFIDDIGPLAFMPQACYADFTADGQLDLFDFLAFVNLFNALDPRADCDDNGTFDLFDFLCFTNAFNAGC